MPDMIAYWAKQTPNAIALVDDVDVTYRVFDLAINKVAAALKGLGLPETGLVAFRMSGMKGVYLIERARDRMGLASAALPVRSPSNEQLDLLKPDVFLTAFPEDEGAAQTRTVALSESWFAEALKGPPAPIPRHQARPADLVRVMVSSGTTGRPKIVEITRASLARRNETNKVIGGFSHATRLMVVMGSQAIGGFVAPYATWSVGGAVTVAGREKIYAGIRRLRPNQLWLSTGQLQALLDNIPPGAPLITDLRVTVMGGQVFRPLAEKTMRRLSPDVWILYGSTEIGVVTHVPAAVLDRHERGVGHVWPTIEIEIVDPDGAPLPAGAIGEVRLRDPGIFSGYRGEGDTASAFWRGGWFYPGDLGALAEDGLLIIHGRTVEVMNLGGVKIDPAAVDEVAKSCPGVADAAAFSVEDEAGVERPWLALVEGEGYDAVRLMAVLKARWPALRTLRLAAIDVVPRNAMAKVERQRLKAMVREAQKTQLKAVN
jgi:acyl-CoA synthetase (AMP-forming)/AMP-acid ligase II